MTTPSPSAHPLEVAFNLHSHEILTAIGDRPRTLMNVRGAVAEVHLRKYLDNLLAQGVIGAIRVGAEGEPDFYVQYGGKEIVIECKNVESPKKDRAGQPRHHTPMTVDFQKTRNQLEEKHGRFYEPDDFDILAACTYNRTGQWEFVYALTTDMSPHRQYAMHNRLDNRLEVAQRDSANLWAFDPNFTPDLLSLMATVAARP